MYHFLLYVICGFVDEQEQGILPLSLLNNLLEIPPLTKGARIRVEEFHPFWKRVELSGELSQKFLEILVLNFTLHFPASLSKQVITRRPPLSYLQGARHPLYKHLLPMHYTSEVFITFEEVQHQFDPLISIFLFV